MNQDTTQSRGASVVAGLFGDSDAADQALVDLKAAGFTRAEISQVGRDEGASAPAQPAEPYDVAGEGSRRSTGSPFFREHESSASSFVDELLRLGFSKRDSHDLVDGLVKGDALVTADAATDLQRAVAILKKYKGDIRYAGATSSTAARSAVDADADVDAREIQLRAERLVVNKERVQHGEARIRKNVVTEMRSIEVPVTHEELVIERHAVTGDAATDGRPIAEQTVRIPLSEEKVNISKQTVVREEVEVGKRRVDDVQHVTDTVRHEELRVDDSSSTRSTLDKP